MSNLIGIYGASGFGREVKPLIEATKSDDSRILFIDDSSPLNEANGVRIISWTQFLKEKDDNKSVAIAIADANIRERLALACASEGFNFHDVRAKNSLIMDNVSIGKGSIICPFVTLTSNIKIGRQFHANIYSYVAHDCEIGDFVTFAPSVKCNGNVWIDDYVYIGTGAILKQGSKEKPLKIGRGATVGMGAVVTKDVEPGAIVVGNPARVLRKD